MQVLLFLLPLVWVGVAIARRAVLTKRAEVLLPAGVIIGMSLYIFWLNVFSYLVSPPISLALAYVFLMILTAFLSFKVPAHKINFPQKDAGFIWIFSCFSWGFFLFYFISKKVGFGGDVTLYYSIAETFTKGNFPLASPWQPDLSVGYHYGAAIFLGATNWFTGLAYDFLHRFLAFALILATTQILIFFFKRHNNFLTYLLYQLIPLTFFILIGTFMLVTPVFPLQLPSISGLREFVFWAMNLPSVHIAFETWGAAVNLGLVIYFLHHFTALSVFITLLFILFHSGSRNLINWTLIIVLLSTLALVNEAVFLPAAFSTATALLLKKEKLIFLFLAGLATLLIVSLQGGIITEIIFQQNPHLEKSVAFFPKEGEVIGNFIGYHSYQQASRNFPIQDVWEPLNYFHLGFKWLYSVSLLVLFFLVFKKKEKQKLFLFLTLLTAAIAAGLAYNFIVPKFKVADGNRLMVLSYQFLGTALAFFSVWLLEGLLSKKGKLKFVVFAVFIWFFGFSLLQPIAEMTRTTLPQNTLLPKKETELAGALAWLKKTPGSKRVLYLDELAPFSSNSSLVMTEAGHFAPTFNSRYRAYTTESDPSYIDMVYSLNPYLLQEFGIDYLVVKSGYFTDLPQIRQKDLENPEFFTLLYETGNSSQWEKVYRVNDKYQEAPELDGLLKNLVEITPGDSKVFIGDWQDVPPWNQLRKSVIFALKDKKPILVWGPGLYLNVLTWVDWQPPTENEAYDYLVLPPFQNPNEFCECQAKIIWQGLNNEVFLWEVLD